MKLSEMKNTQKMIDLNSEEAQKLTEFEGTIVEETLDLEGNLIWRIEISKMECLMAQKYTPLHLTKMKEILTSLDVEDTVDLVNEPMKFKRFTFHIGYDRFLPVRFL
ncbi:MAG: hypothetical protein GF317_01680 [Candidatus Lokiarchaeota archaeon]|nr:hypothetical protein [Candidatus Lokiarchaeota archaeon]